MSPKPTIKPIKRTLFEKFLKYVGCEYSRTRGDHLIYTRIGTRRPIVIQATSEVPAFHVRTNLKTLEIDTEQYLEILEKLR